MKIMQTERYALDAVVISYGYLSPIEQSSEFNSIYREYFEQEFPARVTVGIELAKSTSRIISYCIQGITSLPVRVQETLRMRQIIIVSHLRYSLGA